MERLKKISEMELIRIPRFTADYFQEQILLNLHLEFFFEKSRVLVTPGFEIITTGDASEQEERELTELLETRREKIINLKEYLIYQLAIYSSLIESNSYYISLNNHLVISRFVDVPDHPNDCEVKLYTIARSDLPHNYRDKIYIGRDFISLTKIHRDHFDLKHIRNSLSEQLEKLRSRFKVYLPDKEREELEPEYVDEFAELLIDFREEADEILESFPVDISPRSLDHDRLVDANRRFRELKHILIEMEESARELEAVMFDRNLSRAVRYATKFRKDLTNYSNYFMLKINGRLTDAVNGVHA
jgi:hypothetical protein